MKRLLIFIAVVFFGLPYILFSAMLQEISIGVDARTASMGNAIAVFSTGSQAVNQNPAGVAKTKKISVGASFNRWLLDTSLQELNFAMPAGIGAWGADFVFVNMGEFEMLDDYGNPTGEITRPFTLHINGAYGAQVMAYYGDVTEEKPVISMVLGISGKYIIRNIDNEISQAFSLDTGMMLEYADKFSFAVALKNLSVTAFVDLPSILLLGLAGEIISGVQNRLLAAICVNQQMEGNAKFSFGLEYGFSELFFIRAGYEHDPLLKLPEGAFSGFSCGIGVVMQKLCLDYAFAQKGAAGNSQVVSLNYKF